MNPFASESQNGLCMVRFAIVCLLAVQACATTVTDTIYTPFTSELFNGTVTIECPRTLTAARLTVAKGRKVIQVKDGQFTVSIQPYATSNPPGTCIVEYAAKTSTGSVVTWSEKWLIPDTTVIQKIKDVRK